MDRRSQRERRAPERYGWESSSSSSSSSTASRKKILQAQLEAARKKLELEKQFLETELAIRIEQAELETEKIEDSSLEQLVNPEG